MDFKRIVLLAGHYGSGKTNIAVNLALRLRQSRPRVALADVDIVNPYFRSGDSRGELEAAGVRVICSELAGTNADIPTLPREINTVTDDRDMSAVIDVGGDDRGALALGRWRNAILAEDDYEMLMVINRFRPLTRDVPSTLGILREIEAAARMRFTGIVNNSNLGGETTPELVLDSMKYARALCEAAGLPLKFTSAREDIAAALEGRIENLLPLRLQRKLE